MMIVIYDNVARKARGIEEYSSLRELYACARARACVCMCACVRARTH